MKNGIKKLSDKEKYVKLKEEFRREKLKEEERENLIWDYEEIITSQEMIIKITEIIIIPLFIATFSYVFSAFKMALLKGIIVYIIISLIELSIFILIYSKAFKKKKYAEKILKLIEKI